jgi:hypothetical protein
MLTTTLKQLICGGSNIVQREDFITLMNHLGKNWDTIDDTIISYAEIVELTNFEYAIDCTDANPEFHKTWRKFCLWCGEPIAFLISLSSCREAYETAIKFVNDEVSLEVMKAIHFKAACEQGISEDGNSGMEFEADQMAVDVSNPDVHTCIYNCINRYPLGMNRLGYEFEYSERKLKKKFLEIVS